MERYKGKIAVTVDELTRTDDGESVVSVSNYKKLVIRRRVTVLRRGCYMTQALIEYSTLPERFRKRFAAKYGDPEELLREDERAVVLNDDAHDYFTAAVLPDGKHLSSEQIDSCTLNASVLERLTAEVETQRDARRRAGVATPINWEGIVALSEELKDKVSHTLPANERRLREKIAQFNKEGFESLIPRNMCQRRAQKITDDGGRMIIAMRRSRTRTYSLTEILEKYNEQAELEGWKPLKSVSSIKKYLDRPEIQPKWWGAAYGELAAKQKFDRKHRTEMPSKRDMLWYGDGTKINLYYRGKDSSGRMAKCTISVYEVIDAYSEMMLGYCISPVENFEAQRKAFRMAIETAGYRPYEIVTDNQSGQKKAEAKEFMTRICRLSRRTAPHSPQSKSIEQVFGRFQKQVLAKHWAWTGQNITATSRDSRPNLEFIQANIDNLFTLEEMCRAYAECRQQWNDMPHPRTGKSRRETYYASVNPATQELNENAMVEMFWQSTRAEFTASGIEIQVDGRKYAFEVFTNSHAVDYDFRTDNTGRQFIVKYDPDDLSKVWLCTESSVGVRRVREALPYITIHRAAQEQTDEERQFIRETTSAATMMRVQRQMEGYELEVEHGVAPEQHGLRTPRLAGISRAAVERFSEKYVAVNIPAEQYTTCEPVAVGEAIKEITNMTFDKTEIYNRL